MLSSWRTLLSTNNIHKSPLAKSLLLMLIGLLGYACNVFYTRLLTHNLSLSLYGDFSVAWRSMLLVNQLITFGVGLSAQRFVSMYKKTKQPEKTRAFVYWGASILLRSSFILLIIYALFWIVASITHFTEIHRFDQYHLALFVIIFTPLLSIAMIITSLILSSGYAMVSTVVGTLVYRVIQIVVTLFFVEFFVPKEIYHLSLMLVSILFCTMLINALIYLWIPENEIINTLKPVKKRFIDDEWIAVAQSSCLNSIMFTLAFTADLFILEFFSPYEDHVGIFSVCEVCVSLLSTLQITINSQSITDVMNINIMKPKEQLRLQKILISSTSSNSRSFVYQSFSAGPIVKKFSYFSIFTLTQLTSYYPLCF